MKIQLIFAGFAAILSLRPCVAQESLTVAWYGGNWGDSFNACVAKPFTQATGIQVKPEIGTSNVTLAKLQQQKAAPTIDAAWLDGGVSELAQAAGVLDDLDPASIPNMSNLREEAVYAQGGHKFAVSTGYYALGLTYNVEKVKTPPASWTDLWKPEYADAVAMPSPANSSGVPFLIFLNQILGGTPGSTALAFDKMKQLKAGLYFDSSGAASTAFQTGEVTVGAHFSAAAWDLAAKGLPIRLVVPKEGVWATDARLHLVKGAKNKKAAEQFISVALSEGAARCLAEKLFLAPAIKNVELSPEVSEKLPWGKGGSAKDLKLSDWEKVNAMRPAIVEQWNREIARK
jgi:putative spermidine/putrescine transport system substrate-binding protein